MLRVQLSIGGRGQHLIWGVRISERDYPLHAGKAPGQCPGFVKDHGVEFRRGFKMRPPL